MSDVFLTRADRRLSETYWPGLIALCGALYFALVPLGLAMTLGHGGYIGTEIYDEYYRAIQQGRLDLPPRLLQYEGHYTSDGTGFLYHGIAPLVSRVLVGDLWPAGFVGLGHATIWLSAVIGTWAFQGAFLTVVRVLDLASTLRGKRASLLFCAALWLSSPGLLLSVNPAFYHEPIALAYGAGGLFVLTYVKLACHVWRPGLALLLLAVLAAVVVHARPNVAIGLYLATGVAMGLVALRLPLRRAAMASLLACAVLGAGGAGYLSLNTARFGAADQVHGSFDAAQVQYGRVFWGKEAATSPRAAAFKDHGRFNAARVLPNLGMYLFYIPQTRLVPGSEAVADWMTAQYRTFTEPRLGFIRIERPTGMVLVWSGWLLLAVWGLVRITRLPALWGLVAGVGLAAGVTLSYGTITFRYSFDMWPAVATLGLIGALACLRRLEARPAPVLSVVLVAVFAAGMLGTVWRAGNYATAFRATPETTWSEAFCVTQARAQSMPEARIPHLCRAPEDHSS